ncbi:MAG: hypothetical protein QOF53_892 [Nocardioidaceae bacterium]|jgi:prepilin-type N-terminal cleavage/methylation domain-containing protein|nr:hypothetical protein [Nocardioidaceae bacterium]
MFDRMRAQNEGFTLIELLIAIVISGLILGALATGFIATMAGSQNVHDRFVESHDAQLLSTYFPTDVQSADPTMMNPDTTTGCGGPTSGTHVIRLQWTERDDLNADPNKRLAVFSASYRLVAAPSGSELIRYYCSNTGPAGGSPATILAGATAASHVVAHDLSDVPAPSAVIDPDGRVALTLYSHQTVGEQRAGIAPYSYTLTATMRTPGAFAKFVITNPGSQAAGASFNLAITARTADDTATDLSYTGSKTITFTGASSSPNHTPPTFASTVLFNNGVSVLNSAMVTLVNAGPTTLNLLQGTHRGSVGPINVTSGTFAAGALQFSPCPPDTKKNMPTSLQVTRAMTDTYGNVTTSGGAITVTLSQTGGAAIPGSVSIPANTATSGTFTSTNPGTVGTQITLTGKSLTVPGYSDATCLFTTTGQDAFLVTAPGPHTAGSAFPLTITASVDGVNPDPSYPNGPHTIVFTGPSSSPNGTAPFYPPTATTVTFSGGVGTASGIKLYKAETVNLTASEGTISGAVSIAVAPASMALSFSPCPGTKKKQDTTEAIIQQDAFGNAATTAATVTLSATNGSFSVPTVTVPANTTQSGPFMYTTPSTSGVSVVMTAQAPGATDGTCGPFTTTS